MFCFRLDIKRGSHIPLSVCDESDSCRSYKIQTKVYESAPHRFYLLKFSMYFCNSPLFFFVQDAPVLHWIGWSRYLQSSMDIWQTITSLNTSLKESIMLVDLLKIEYRCRRRLFMKKFYVSATHKDWQLSHINLLWRVCIPLKKYWNLPLLKSKHLPSIRWFRRLQDVLPLLVTQNNKKKSNPCFLFSHCNNKNASNGPVCWRWWK